MPLALDDPKWKELGTSYGDTSDVVTWLAEAHQTGRLTGERLGDLINEVQHQGDTTTAMYAVAPHLISLARASDIAASLDLLSHAGLIYTASTRPDAVPCPAFLQAEFEAHASGGANLLAPLIPKAKDFDAFKYAVAALAGLTGHHAFGRLLAGFDLYEGKFYHTSLEDPFPPETE